MDTYGRCRPRGKVKPLFQGMTNLFSIEVNKDPSFWKSKVVCLYISSISWTYLSLCVLGSS